MQLSVNNVAFTYADRRLTARISGDVDHHTARRVREAVDAELYLRRPDALTLDLAEVSFMDSSGLGLILGRYNAARELGCDYSLKNVGEAAMRIIRLAGADKLIKIEED